MDMLLAYFPWSLRTHHSNALMLTSNDDNGSFKWQNPFEKSKIGFSLMIRTMQIHCAKLINFQFQLIVGTLIPLELLYSYILFFTLHIKLAHHLAQSSCKRDRIYPLFEIVLAYNEL